MPYDFDVIIDRRNSDSVKWNYVAEDVLPMWVADMDFYSPPPIIDALQRRAAEGVFGYAANFPALYETIRGRLQRLYGWEVAQEEIVLLPGLVSGLNVVASAVGAPGDGVLVNTPVYGPFLSAPTNQGRTLQSAAQTLVTREDGTLHYEVDFDALNAAVLPETRLTYLCSPHNPTGRVWTQGELESFANMAVRHDLIICSDDIHCDLLLDDGPHLPIATLAPDIARRTITLLAPSKTFNVPGLGASLAIVQDKALRKQLEHAGGGIVPHLNLMGAHAMQAAYGACDEWLAELLVYLRANRDFAVDFIRTQMPQLRCTRPQATYLLWIDCREANLPVAPDKFFLEHAKVALNDGAWFGAGGEGFVRLNFGCPRATLTEGLTRMRDALTQL
jgi:cystathionine beta-lyase